MNFGSTSEGIFGLTSLISKVPFLQPIDPNMRAKRGSKMNTLFRLNMMLRFVVNELERHRKPPAIDPCRRRLVDRVLPNRVAGVLGEFRISPEVGLGSEHQQVPSGDRDHGALDHLLT